MDELCAVWLSPQSEDDLRDKILLSKLELETVRMEMNKIKHQSEVNEKQLNAQLQLAYKERDEAKQQLQQLLDIFMLAPTQPQTLKKDPSDNKIILTTTNPHSGLTDHSNSDVDSFFDTVSSNDKSCKHTAHDSSKQYDDDDDEELVNSNLNNPTMLLGGGGQTTVDLNHAASIVIDQLVKGKVLPCRGRLLEAVMTAGPTLEAIMLAGPFPQWKNPPPAAINQLLEFQPVLTNNGIMINNNGAAKRRAFKPNYGTFAPTNGSMV